MDKQQPTYQTARWATVTFRPMVVEEAIPDVLHAPIKGGYDVYRKALALIDQDPREHFLAFYVDAKGQPLGAHVVSIGTATSSLVHPREVFSPALVLRAAAVIVAHNHPSGDTEPSAEDRTTTRRLQRAGRLLGIELLDHVVVGRNAEDGFYSFLENGAL